ncbi:MAG TPA: inorganic phosphate transporter [Candidatus Coprenecus stercoravium]|uniref:Phosphate transporter n=1 Tax=Candidatus Coprenecus stercoravium TaxID=2840735 RepID=A0A9D2GPG0_9BACT|nr:inorganic phosphate transporter [Candidatus Coprenecus stercoravium]
MEFLYIGIVIFLFCLAISDIIVGVSNDAVNFLNSAVGSKTAKFKNLIIIASIGVFLGASLSNGMMDIARHGIFQPQYFTFSELICIMLAVMVTDVILLDAFNSRGLPTSTTVSLVFELLGGTVALAMIKNIQTDGALSFAQMINTDKALSVILGIFLSIAIAFVFGMIIQWIVRTIFTFNYKPRLKYLAGVFGGIAVTAIVYFLLIKGLKDSSFMTADANAWIKEHTGMLVLCLFVGSSIIMQILYWCKVNILKVIVLLGTLSLAMAFAGNDLVNFVGVPLAGYSAYQDYAANGVAVGADNYLMGSLLEPAHTPMIFLILSGATMVFALATSRKARNVINTEVNLTNQNESDAAFGTSATGRRLVQIANSFATWLEKVTPVRMRNWIDSRFNKDEAILVKGAAFDQMRAAVNLVVSSLLIALGTSLKLPLSTTFVTFTVAMGTSLMDRAWDRESAVGRVTGMMSVMGGWLLTAVIAFAVCFVMALLMHYGGFVAMILLSIVAMVIIVRSNIQFNRKSRSKEKDKTVFEQVMSADDPEQVWTMLKGQIQENTVKELDYVSNYYTTFVDCFVSENLKCLRRNYNTLHAEIEGYKSVRRKEILALKRTDPAVSMQASTWFHLESNHLSQLLYSLKRISEPCKEHLENNFNPLPKGCVEEFAPASEAFLVLLKRTSEYVGSATDDAKSKEIIKEISSYKKSVAVLRKNNLDRFNEESDTSNFNIYVLYQTILQETQQMADDLKHLIRAYTYLSSVKGKEA